MADTGTGITVQSIDAPYIQGLSSVLEDIQGRLGDFTRSTEGEFLQVGEGLHQFHGRSMELSGKADAAVELMLGDEVSGIMAGLQSLLERINRYAATLEDESEGAEKGLREILAKLDEVGESVTGFRKIVKTMTILGLSTKIENARNVLDEESFNILADDLIKLAQNIENQAKQVQFQLTGLDRLVREALQKILGLKARQRQHAQKILSDTLENVALLSEKNQTTSQGTEDIALFSSRIAEKIGEVVISIQSHDLTRQQVEHVAEALGDLLHKVAARVAESSGEPAVQVEAMVAEVCRLQEAQLASSKDQLVTAVIGIKESLREIAVNILAMADQTGEIAGSTNETGFTFLAEMEQGTAMIASALKENSDANRESAATLSSLSYSVAEMEDFLAEIERIGGEMKVLALNAGIKAARISEGGAGLAVIAEAIQKLSANALLQTQAVSRQLREITASARDLCAGNEGTTDDQTLKVEAFLREIGTSLETLRRLNGDIIGNLTGMEEEGRSLATDIDLLASGMSVQERAVKLFDCVQSELNSLGSRHPGAEGSGNGEDDLSGVYCDLADHYTMSSEREVHQSIAGKNKSGTGQPPGGKMGSGSGSDLGDNVELF